ncbi:MAG: phosphoribosyltransferase [Gammaproteobacteria bacterium]|nr:phosphoribosyltransferase [Gammaproteobacteria bacterium]
MQQPNTRHKTYVDEAQLIQDSYRLACAIFDSGFKPDFIVGLWRGGSTVGIYVQECLQYLGIETDHISIRTSYQGLDHYIANYDRPENIRVHGLQYLLENLCREHNLLLVDDVFSTGRNVQAVIDRLQLKLKRNMPADTRVASVYCKPQHRKVALEPDFYIHSTEDWLVLPYELQGLSQDEIAANKPWALPFLKI